MNASRRRRAHRGSAQLEVLISVLLLAVAAAAVFAALLSSSYQTKTASDREQASLQIENLLDELRNFTTADKTGPGPATDNTWKVYGDSCAGCAALDPGLHDVSSRLPAAMLARNATLTYTVSPTTVNGVTLNQVSVQLDWDPSQ